MYYSGEKLFVYGHFSDKAIIIDHNAQPLITKNTVCIDTSEFNLVSALILPERIIVHSKELKEIAKG